MLRFRDRHKERARRREMRGENFTFPLFGNRRKMGRNGLKKDPERNHYIITYVSSNKNILFEIWGH